MIDDFAKKIINSLMIEMEAIDASGNIDHKTRLYALREARAFITSLLPKLSKEDRETFSHAITGELKKKMDDAQAEEEQIIFNKFDEEYNKMVGNK